MLGFDRESRRKDTQDVKDWFASTPGMVAVVLTAVLLVWSVVSSLF